MKIRMMATAAGASMGLALAMWMVPKALAQEWDQVQVNLPYPVTVGEKILPAGDYTIEKAHLDTSNVLQFYADNGMKFETSAMTNDAVYGNTEDNLPPRTLIILQHVGDAYYFHKLFIQGMDYGFELPLPAKVREEEKNATAEEVTLPASTSTKSTSRTTNTAIAPTNPSPAVAPVPATNTDNTAQATADNTAPAQPQPAPAVAPPPPTPTPAPLEPQVSADTTPDNSLNATSSDQGSANREKQPDKMPATSADWLVMLLSGGTLSGAGMLLRRKAGSRRG